MGSAMNGTNIAIQVGWAEWNEAQHANLAITTNLVGRLPAPIRHYPFPLNSAAQLDAELLGFT
jgi:hypothetical protein